MARTTKDTDRDRDSDREGQTVRRMPDPDLDVGPYFPSGMSAPEAGLAGATANMSDRDKAILHGEDPDGKSDRRAIDKKKDNDE